MERLKFDGLNYYVRNRQTGKWAIAKVLKGDVISAPTSRGTSCPLSSVRFMLTHPGPYTIDMIVQLAFEGELHKFYGWIQGLWTEETRRAYFNLLKESGQPLNEHTVKNHHNPFYRNISKVYDGKLKYRQFLLDMGENPDDISGLKNVYQFAAEGRHIESEIIKLLNKLSHPFIIDYRSKDNRVHPDLYNINTDEAIDIKRHIGTNITKEIETYQKYFSRVTVIFLLGSRSLEINKLGVRKVSVFKWIKEQSFFQVINSSMQEKIMNELEDIVERVSLKLAVNDRNDFHQKLVNQIIALDKQGYTSPRIAEKVGFSYKYVHLILRGKSLKEYSGDYPIIYKERREEEKKVSEKIRELTFSGQKVKEIAAQLELSVDMVRYFLRKHNLNEKLIIEERNKRLRELFSTVTDHRTLTEKFKWVVKQMKSDYPNLTFTAVKTYYYLIRSVKE